MSVSQIFLLAGFFFLTGCQRPEHPLSTPQNMPESAPVLGIVSSFYPDTTQVGVQALKDGGTAADAVAAMGFYLAATQPAFVSLLGTGQCVVSDKEGSRQISFVQTVPETRLAMPVMARGLFTLHARNGQLGWQRILEPAISTAQTGFPVSAQLIADFKRVQMNTSSSNDLGAFDQMFEVGLKPGDRLKNPALAQTLNQIAQNGTGVLYQEPYRSAFTNTLSKHHISIIGGQMKGNKPVWNHEFPLMTQSFVGPATVFALDENEMAVQCSFEMETPFGSGYYVDEIGAFIANVPPKMSDVDKTRALFCPKGLTIQTEHCQINQTLLAKQKTKVVFE